MDQFKFEFGRFKGLTYQEANDSEEDYSKFLLEIINEDRVTLKPFQNYVQYVKSSDVKAM